MLEEVYFVRNHFIKFILYLEFFIAERGREKCSSYWPGKKNRIALGKATWLIELVKSYRLHFEA